MIFALSMSVKDMISFANHILHRSSCWQEEESRRDERLKYNCKCSFLEIYNEQITDLLEPSSTNLQVILNCFGGKNTQICKA